MANLENNNDKENSKSVSQQIGDSVHKGVENIQETVKHAGEFASDAIHHPKETAEALAEQAKQDIKSVKWWAKLLQILFWTALILFAAFLIIINLPATKNWIAKRVTDSFVNEKLKTNIHFENVDVDYFGNITIHKVTVKDYKNFDFIKAKELYADSNWFSIIDNSRNLKFQSLSLDELDLKVITYKGDSIANFVRFVDLFNTGPADPKKPPFELKSRIFLTNSKVSIINQNHEGDSGKWLDAKNVNLIIPELKVKGPEVNAQINNLRFETTRWGKKHNLDTFSTHFTLNKKYLSLKDLTLNTDHTLLQGDLKFLLNNGSWEDFTNKVRWEMNLKQGSEISGYDISYFATNWDNYKPINLHGKMNGMLNNFELQDFVMGNREVNIRTSKIELTNLLNGKLLINTKNISTDFTYKNLKAMLPSFISKKMKNFADDFGRLKYNGDVRIMPEQIHVAKGNLITGIGRANLSNFYLTDYSTTMPKYKGYAEVFDLNTSVITKNKQVGLITGKFNIDGQSFDVNTMRIRTKSQIAKIDIMDKEINNILLDGILDKRTYNGIVQINDEQAKAEIKGFLDFRTKRIFADVDAAIQHLNINYFAGKPGNQILNGKIQGKIGMTNLNDLNLDAELNDLNFLSGTQKYHVANANVKVFFENGNRVFSVDAPGAVNGKISGKYNLSDLQGMVMNGLNKILVGPPPKKLYRGQQFNMEFNVEQSLINYFLPDLRIPKGAFIIGSYDGNANNLVLNVDAPELKYYMTKQKEITEADRVMAATNPDYKLNPRDLISKDSAMVNNMVIRINTANLDEQIFAKIDRAEFNKNIFKDIILTGRNENNQLLRLAANFKHGTPEEELEDQLKTYAININQSTNSSGDYVVRFDPTNVQFNNVVWNIDTSVELNHSITYRKKTKDFLIENLRLYSDNSELFIKNAVYKSSKDFQADADLKNLQLSKIFEMQEGGNTMNIQGIANGTIQVKMNNGNLEPILNVNVNNITMNSEDLGDLIINAKNSSVANVFDIEAKITSAGLIGDNKLDLIGTINNNTPSPTLDLNADMKDFDLRFTNQFVKGVFSNVRGKANGILKISGPLNNIDYSGDIALRGLGLKLNFTGVDYSADDTVVSIQKGFAPIDLNLRDGRENSFGNLSGGIWFETLSSMAVQIILRSKNLLVLNTQQKDFDLFWGRVYGQGELYIDGPVSGLNLSTNPNEPFRTLNGSSFTFNSGSTSGVDEYKMLRFLKRDKAGDLLLENKKRSGANMNIDFRVAVDKGTTVRVIVGEEVGDISVKGNSNEIRFQMSREGNIAMNGAYTVDNGTYTSKAVVNKTFQIAKGSSIRWEGDAMTPALDITANYVRTVSNLGDYLGVNNIPPISVQLQTRITQTLNNPLIDLNLSAIDVSSQIKETLAAKMAQEDEKVIQFGSILFFNTFNTINTGLDAGNIAQNTGVNLAFRQLTSLVNNISNQVQFDIDYVSADPSSNTLSRAKAAMNIELSPRWTLKTGVGIPLSKSTEGNVTNDYLSGEGTVEYDLSKKNDGTLLLRGYSKPMNIGMSGSNGPANQAYGGGVVWRKSFNSIFKKKKKDKKTSDKNKQPVTDSTKKDTIK